MLLVPIKLAVLGITAGSLAGLPVIVATCGSQQIDARVVATLDEEFSVQQAGVHDMGAGQKVPLLQRGVDLGGGPAISCRAGCGFDRRDELRPIILTGVGDLPFVADPRGVDWRAS